MIDLHSVGNTIAARQSKSHEFADNQEGQEAWIQHWCYSQILRELFRRTSGPYQRDCLKWANHDGLQGVKDSWATG
jgi:hypothetical protein